MKAIKIILAFIILGLTSCNTSKLSKSTPTEGSSEIFQVKILHADNINVTSFECEDFVSKALINYDIAKISKEYRFLNNTKEPVINIHDRSIIDTVYTFSNSKNKIQIYRSKQKDIIFTFDVTDPKITLTGNIKTGMSKDLFSKKFMITKSFNNEVQITNPDGTLKLIFYFQNNRLKQIKSDFYLD